MARGEGGKTGSPPIWGLDRRNFVNNVIEKLNLSSSVENDSWKKVSDLLLWQVLTSNIQVQTNTVLSDQLGIMVCLSGRVRAEMKCHHNGMSNQYQSKHWDSERR